MSVRQVDLVKRWGCTAGAVSMMVRDGMPLTSVEAAESWRKAHRGWNGDKKSTPLFGSGTAADEAAQPGTTEQEPGGDGLQDMLRRIRNAERDAHKRYEALAKQDGRGDEAGAALRAWERAAGMRMDLEGKIEQHLRECGQRLDKGQVEDMVGKVLGEIPKIMKRWPNTLAPRCNPSEPEVARLQLREAVEQFFSALGKVVGK